MAPAPALASDVAGRAAALVRALAREPRPAGSAAEGTARAACAQWLAGAGFEVREEPFDYSSAVGRWGTPVGGAIASLLVVVAAVEGARGRAGFSLALLTLGAVALAAAGRALARRGVLDWPMTRAAATNLVATRGMANPPLWLMAHLDSKSQPIPIAARAAGIVLLGSAWAATMLVALTSLLGGAAPGGLWLVLGSAAVLGALPVVSATVGSRSPGALDNATGVATVLSAAALTIHPLGVCLTSAEELGLAGARAWARRRRAQGVGGVAINCDGVDDAGAATCMYSGQRPDELIRDLVAAADAQHITLRAHRLLPGVLTDGVALADAGWSVVTLSKGGIRTLARIHTTRDSADRLTGTGVAEIAGVIAAFIERRDVVVPAASPSAYPATDH